MTNGDLPRGDDAGDDLIDGELPAPVDVTDADDELELVDLEDEDEEEDEEEEDEDDGDELDDLKEEAQAAILNAILKLAGSGASAAEAVLDLAEAYAWLEEPESDHGG